MGHQIYLDYCATTPVHPDVRAAMLKTLEDEFGNPSSMHWAGRSAARLLDKARLQVAQGIGCQPQEIAFTSGATEADNLALLGIMRQRPPGKAHLITSVIEHHAILHTARQLEREGYPVTYVPVDSQGLVDPDIIRKELRPETALISIMLVNNEVGAVQPLEEIGALAREHGILMHTDAVQGLGLLDIDVDALHIDLLSLSAHKIYGPKGVGALYVRQNTRLAPLQYGGGQEGGARPGTENMPGIAGLGAAVELTHQHKTAERQRLTELRQYLNQRLRQCIPNFTVNGPVSAAAPHVISASFPGADGEMLLLRLNAEGFALSMGSACTSKSIEPSHVLTAMGLTREQIESTLRISLGYPTTPEEIHLFLKVLPGIYRKSLAA
jgi:cysteine desulfurase